MRAELSCDHDFVQVFHPDACLIKKRDKSGKDRTLGKLHLTNVTLGNEQLLGRFCHDKLPLDAILLDHVTAVVIVTQLL